MFCSPRQGDYLDQKSITAGSATGQSRVLRYAVVSPAAVSILVFPEQHPQIGGQSR